MTVVNRFLHLVVLAVFAISLLPAAQAQRGSVSEADILGRSEVWQELGLTDEQTKKLEELKAKSSPGRDFFEPYLKRIAEEQDPEKDKAIRAEMTEAVTKARATFRTNAISVLNDGQKKQLRGMFLRGAGARAFTDANVAKEYGITSEQSEKLSELNSQRRSASRALGFDASEEEREKFNKEWQEKFENLLTEKQRARYTEESSEQTTAVADSTQFSRSAAGGGEAEGTENASAQQSQAPPGESMAAFGGGTQPGERRLVSEFSFNFRYAPWDQVLQMFADGAGLTLDLNQVPPGTFSHLDDRTYSASQALDIMNGYLLRKGYCMVQKDNFLIILNIDNGIPPSLIPEISVEELLKLGDERVLGDNQLGSVTISMEDMDTSRAAQEIEAMLGPQGSLVALTESKILIVTDTGANLRRVHGLLMTAMSKAKPDALIFKSYFIKNMDAEEAEIAVMTQFGMRQNVTNVSASAEERSRMQARMQAGRSQPSQRSSTSTEAEIQIASDVRLNSLLVTGTAKQHELVETILTALDVAEAPDGSPLSRERRGTYLQVYKVQSADAREVTKTLSAMNIPGVNVVNEDGQAGTIHIMATSRMHEEVAALIRQLDSAGVGGSVAVIQLAQMDPLSAAATLRSLFYADGDAAPTIEADSYGRRLIIRGSVDQIAQIRQVLGDLGEDGSGVRQRTEGGQMRQFSLQGRNPERFLRILQEQWDSQNQATKINIVIPNQENPIRSRRTAEEVLDSPQEDARIPVPDEEPRAPLSQMIHEPQRRGPSVSVSSSRRSPQAPRYQTTRNPLQADDGQANDGNQPPPRPDWNPGDRQKLDDDVFVQLFGDDLILWSNDETALDRLEDMLDFLQQSIPMKPEYTVVYLKAADALEAADMLAQFFPSSSVSSTSSALSSGSLLGDLGGSLSNVGSSLLDVTGLSGLAASSSTLKIIPDVRTNSLFLTGPQALINDALAFLKVLDSNDIPESLKDLQPRQIEVKHADVNDVAALLRDVFRPYMEAQNQGGRQQQNPLAAMFGGGNRGANDNDATQVRMTLGVDSQTSILTVNSSQEIYQEVERVVLQMDEAARVARPTVRSIQLKNADAVLIQQTLTSLFPRVSVTTSRSSSRPASSSSGNTNSRQNPQGNDANADAVNRAIQERIRQRFQGGGGDGGGAAGGARPFGGGGGPGGRGPGARGGGGGGRGPGGRGGR